MKNSIVFVLYFFSLLALFPACKDQSNDQKPTGINSKTEKIGKAEYALVIHGGAGTILKENMTTEREEAYISALNSALTIGEEILKKGGSGLDAVEQTIVFMEDSPLFNAGKGAVFTNEGKNEFDASIMEGETLNAGAVGGITGIKNPIKAAIAVMETSEQVFLSGEGATQFAKENGLESVPDDYFFTQRRWDALQRAKEKDNKTGTHELEKIKFGTVGCLALDKEGNLFAGTSTGGRTNKKYNRIGDSPVIGAGNYANNNTCAVSGTGHGEYFLRYVVAYDVSALMEYKGLNVQEAANQVINVKLKNAKGAGGLIALDKNGNIAMPFNTPGMYRGYVKPHQREVKIYKE